MTLPKALVLILAIAIPCLGVAADAVRPAAPTHAVTVLRTSAAWDGTPIAYPAGRPEVTAMTVEIGPGKETGWHLHHVPSFGYMLQGELEVHLKDGRVKRLMAGDTIAEVVGTLHNGVNAGRETARIVVFYTGVQGQALTWAPDGAPPM
jgi:quercetin dioxygenase-like cupin family protein